MERLDDHAPNRESLLSRNRRRGRSLGSRRRAPATRAQSRRSALAVAAPRRRSLHLRLLLSVAASGNEPRRTRYYLCRRTAEHGRYPYHNADRTEARRHEKLASVERELTDADARSAQADDVRAVLAGLSTLWRTLEIQAQRQVAKAIAACVGGLWAEPNQPGILLYPACE